MAERKEKGVDDNRDQKSDEIEKRIEKILADDPEHGHEKITLFIARMALRLFPLLGGNGKMDVWGSEINRESIKHFIAIWRAAIAAFFKLVVASG